MEMKHDLLPALAAQWAAEMETFALPAWDELPRLELYMDQVLILLTEYLGPMNRGNGEKGITASSINNYVRLKIIPAPVKKKYGRIHMASLLMLFCLKRSMSMTAIRRMLPEGEDEETHRAIYEAFRRQLSTIAAEMAQQLKQDIAKECQEDGAVTAAAILSNLTTDLTEYLLQIPEE